LARSSSGAAPKSIAPATGRLGILTPGLGAVATTFMAGVESIRRGRSKPIGSLTQMATIRLGKRTDKRAPLIKDFVPLAKLDDIVFGAWDPIPDDALTAAKKAGVLEDKDIEPIADFLRASSDAGGVRQPLCHPHSRHEREEGKDEARSGGAAAPGHARFQGEEQCDRLVIVWCASTEIYIKAGPQHATIEQFEKAMDKNDEAIAPSMLYAYAAIMEGIPFCNGAPNLCVDTPALLKLAQDKGVPISGKDFKTGQTWMKTVVAPGLKAACSVSRAGIRPTSWVTATERCWMIPSRQDKGGVEAQRAAHDLAARPLSRSLQGFTHVVRINYYPPRGDNKEGWDNIDIVGWMNYPMQIKINVLCRDSILAAPIVLDLALFSDFAHRAGMKGIQEWLSFYYKSPMTAPGLQPEHDLFIQQTKLKNTLRHLMGEDQITHLGLEYYA